MLDSLLMGFGAPERLWWLVLVPAVGGLYLLLSSRFVPGRRNRRLAELLPTESKWKRHFSVMASLLSLTFLVMAFARPVAYVEVPRERATVVLAIDVSRSMAAQDVAPDRLAAAKEAAMEFVDMLPQGFNLAVVSFAASTAIVLPPSTDRGAAKRVIAGLELLPSTAIGDAIYTSLDALKLAPPDPDHPDEPAPGAIVLLSDGATNVGKDSATAAKAAKEKGVPIYTIAYGTANGYVINNGQLDQVPVDHYELSRIAQLSGGKKFSAESKQDLSEVYETIARQIGYVEEASEVTERFAGVALLFAVFAGIGAISMAARWP
ncbi:MAG: VWA domain-containing protein [Propionibacteriaceae bacterium]|jgi:Ca-activated chloride channel family protein|nr:VWA domain-containing protein [Propionibacteriaceae bacterium]